MTQFGLFEGPENVKTRNGKLDEAEALRQELRDQVKPAPLPVASLRIRIMRGFLSLHFETDPELLMDLPLKLLGGKCLRSLCVNDYTMAHAWIQEYRLHPEDKHRLIEPLEKIS
jgi:hypothetical protein